ncbi:IPExxxVDY family protein [Mangrovimonas sp. ST2L15]|uniref:IPExxxVDY family protein n=1 Tax=Mangrovimonas sp. ST2L15 TaxID=1645916 RepID=UPI0006B5DDD8|nr:IPExxxVDY family protein [Mangrovimonas sp. ST2L15]
MAIRKLNLDDFFDEIEYTLIGIHTSIEDYRLVYLLNKALNLRLVRKREDVDFKNNARFSLFEWENPSQMTIWNVVSNICKVELSDTKNDGSTLFGDDKKITKTFYLMPEFKNVNYFLKICDDFHQFQVDKRIVNRIQEISQISTAYKIEPNLIKSKDNLIFN